MDWVTFTYNAITWLLVLIGWWYASKENSKSFQRQELRQTINKLDRDLSILHGVATNYFCKISNKSSNAIKDEVKIKRLIDILHTRAKQLGNSFEDSKSKLSDYCDYITAHDKFENRSFKNTLEYNSEDILMMHLYLKEVIESLEETFDSVKNS